MTKILLRSSVQSNDIIQVKNLVANTGFFSAEEILVAGELVEEKLLKGENCSYQFLFAETADGIVGYTCFGLIPFTDRRFDLYWIAVDPTLQKQGIGKMLLQNTETLIVQQDGVTIYAETSGRLEYLPTRNFYVGNGYQSVAELLDFYRTGDNKVIFCKNLLPKVFQEDFSR